MKEINDLINHSIINIDKPEDWTSFDVVNYIRKALRLKKAGHIGTLDPMVTGCLPICLGKATKIQIFLMKKDKTYIGMMHLHKDIEKKQLEKEVKKFIGKITQLPPKKSAVKRQERERQIHEFKILKIKSRDVEFIAKVEAGTYIRKLIHDLGLKIGGAHMTKLRRIQAGVFDDKSMITMEKFKKIVDDYRNGKEESLRKTLIPIENIIKKVMPVISVKKESIEKLRNGSPLFEGMLKDYKDIDKITKNDEAFAIMCDNEIIEIAKRTEQFENEEILAKPEVVLE
jgi:H/ACA ribonucleoprotein complex subunit 4